MASGGAWIWFQVCLTQRPNVTIVLCDISKMKSFQAYVFMNSESVDPERFRIS